MSFCDKCGSNIEPNENFCPKCGNNLETNNSITAPYQEFNPIINTNIIPDSMQPNIKNKKDRTRLWLIIKLVVCALFIALLFLSGMIRSDGERNYEFSSTDPDVVGRSDSLYYNPSFFEYSNYQSHSTFPWWFYEWNYDVWLPAEDEGIPQISFTSVIFIIIVALLLLEIVFSFIRILKFKYVKINYWQLILPILIFILFITSCVYFHFNTFRENERYTYEITSKGDNCKRYETFPHEIIYTDDDHQDISNYELIYKENYSYRFGSEFVLAIAVYIIMLAIDLYTIKKVKLLQKRLQ